MKTIVLFFLCAIAAHASVNVLPMSPKIAEPITIEYVPVDADVAWATSSKNFHAVFFAFNRDAEAPVAVEIPLSKSDKRWTGKFTPASDVVYGLIKVGDGIRYDINGEMFWNVLIHDAKGKILRDAHLKAGIAAFGMLPQECRRKQDLEEAEAEMLEEVKLYPNNTAAQVNLVMLQKNNKEIDATEANARLKEIADGTKTFSSVVEAISISQAYKQIGNTEEAMRVMREASSKFPGSKIEEQSKLEELANATNVTAYLHAINVHLLAFPKTFAKQNLLDAAIQSAARGGNMRELVAFLDNTPGISAITIYQAVNYIGANDSLRKDSYRLIDKGLAATSDVSIRPTYISSSEWNEQQRISKSLLYFVKGAILSDEGKDEEGLAALKTAVELGGDQTDKSVYEQYVKTLVKVGRKKEAANIASAAISKGAATQGVFDAFRTLMREQGMDSASAEVELGKLRDQSRKLLARELTRSMLNQPMIDGALTTLDGRPLRISDWKGKVVLIDYWATWCGPCRKSFPAMQKLFEMYRNNPEVTFAIVNVWERGDDRVKIVNDFLKNNPSLTFPVYLDTNDSVVSKYGVTGIPTKFFLGKDGRIQFKEVGYLPEEQFLEESTNRIELLLAQ
ncbi:MAG: redoxin family protein [Ignavibacteria bacterium]|nr:redoxin family protein [Ignavibacteria bacterium]